MEEALLREGKPEDLPDLVAIYNHYVETSHATFDTRPFAVAEREEWFGQFGSDGPHRLLVCIQDGALLGYATSTPLKPKPAYSISVETSVYLAPGATGRGLGRMLMVQLLHELEASELHGAYAQIALPGAASVALHQALGYRHVGTLREVGRKFGRLHDVAWYERRLG